MANHKYFLITTLLFLVFITAFIKCQPAENNLNKVVNKIAAGSTLDYQNYKLISIKYFNY